MTTQLSRPSSASSFVALLPIFIGVLAFMLVVGPHALNPLNIAWLGEGDPATHYLGWVFFRQSDWAFPIGLNPTYGLELSNSILYSDSNPLLAFVFKPFSGMLPDTFQYLGLWLFICFVLQSWFGWKLAGLISSRPIIRLLCTGLFVFAPPMIFRLIGHYSSVGHWLMLAALYLGLRPNQELRMPLWGGLLVMAAAVHAYFLAMAMVIWLSDMADGTIRDRSRAKAFAIEIPVVFVAVAVACWQIGYFSVGGGVVTGAYGLGRMNLMSLFDPSPSPTVAWSFFLPDIPNGPGDYEGFSYLGSGVIVIVIAALLSLRGRLDALKEVVARRPVLFLAAVGLLVFSLSNNVGIAQYNLHYPIPPTLERAASIFRACGRMFWPVFYLIVFACLCAVVRYYSNRTATALLAAALLIQVADTSIGWRGFNRKLMVAPASTWATPMKSRFWSEAAAKYSKLRYIEPSNHTPHWLTLAAYAGANHMATDAVYLARMNMDRLSAARQAAARSLQTGQYDTDTLYVLDESQMLKAALTLDADSDLLAQIDGLNVLAPGWRRCAGCLKVDSSFDVASYLAPVEMGESLKFAASNRGTTYLVDGWSSPENWGTWSDGASATIALPAPKAARGITIGASALVSPKHIKQVVEITVNGTLATTATLTERSGNTIDVPLPPTLGADIAAPPLLKLGFKFPDAARPVDLGINGDTRALSLGLHTITFH